MLVAVAAAWASVLVAIALPLERWVDLRGLRLAGAASLATVAARVLGVPLPPEAPLVVLAAGLALVAWRVRTRPTEGAGSEKRG